MKSNKFYFGFVAAFLFALSSLAEIIAVFDAGGLNAAAPLYTAVKLERKLIENFQQSLYDTFNTAVGVSSGAQATALLFEDNFSDGRNALEEYVPRRSASQALDIFFKQSVGTFQSITDFAEELVASHVSVNDINRVIRLISENGLKRDLNGIKKILPELRFNSSPSVLLHVNQIIEKIPEFYQQTYSDEAKSNLASILRTKLENEFGHTKFKDFSSKNIFIAAATPEKDPVLFGNLDPKYAPSLYESPFVYNEKSLSLAQALMASAAFDFLPSQSVKMGDDENGFELDLIDGAEAFGGMSPLELAVRHSMATEDRSDLIIVFGNGGPVNNEYFKSLGLSKDRYSVVITKNNPEHKCTIMLLQPNVLHWYYSAIVEDKSAMEELLQAVDTDGMELALDHALSLIGEHMASSKTTEKARSTSEFKWPKKEIGFKDLSASPKKAGFSEETAEAIKIVGVGITEVIDAVPAFDNLFNGRGTQEDFKKSEECLNNIFGSFTSFKW